MFVDGFKLIWFVKASYVGLFLFTIIAADNVVFFRGCNELVSLVEILFLIQDYAALKYLVLTCRCIGNS